METAVLFGTEVDIPLLNSYWKTLTGNEGYFYKSAKVSASGRTTPTSLVLVVTDKIKVWKYQQSVGDFKKDYKKKNRDYVPASDEQDGSKFEDLMDIIDEMEGSRVTKVEFSTNDNNGILTVQGVKKYSDEEDDDDEDEDEDDFETLSFSFQFARLSHDQEGRFIKTHVIDMALCILTQLDDHLQYLEGEEIDPEKALEKYHTDRQLPEPLDLSLRPSLQNLHSQIRRLGDDDLPSFSPGHVTVSSGSDDDGDVGTTQNSTLGEEKITGKKRQRADESLLMERNKYKIRKRVDGQKIQKEPVTTTKTKSIFD